MPSEMIDFVVDQTEFNIAVRYGGDLELIKSFIASGFPVVVEKGLLRRGLQARISPGWDIICSLLAMMILE